VDSFKKELLAAISQGWSEKATGLIRKHDKNLEKGDFSFPNITNKKAWAKHNVKEMHLEKIIDKIPKIEKIDVIDNICVVFLKRGIIFEEFFKKTNSSSQNIKTTKPLIVNFDTSKPNSSSLTTARAACFYEVLDNLDLPQHLVVGISSTDVKFQLDNYQSDKVKVAVKVGAVLGKEDKKEDKVDFSNYKSKVHEEIKELDEERCDEHENVEKKERRLETLVEASIRFSFLGSNISNPVKIILSSSSNPNASFVLYNSARIKKLLDTFDECVLKGDYPPLPSRDKICYDGLTETGEWELLFNFLLTYSDIIEECVSTFSIHKLVQFLVSLASTYSRYYNKVKLLKEPLPHLIPVIHARVKLIEEVNRVFVDALRILNINTLSKM